MRWEKNWKFMAYLDYHTIPQLPKHQPVGTRPWISARNQPLSPSVPVSKTTIIRTSTYQCPTHPAASKPSQPAQHLFGLFSDGWGPPQNLFGGWGPHSIAAVAPKGGTCHTSVILACSLEFHCTTAAFKYCDNNVGLNMRQILYLVKIRLGEINWLTRLRGSYNSLRVVYWPAPS